MWCAKIEVQEESVQLTDNFKDIQAAAKLAAVAIPLWYVIGKNHQDSDKYCVITNWWKYRMSDGAYRLPSLDPSLYAGQDFSNNSINDLLAQATTGENGGEMEQEFGII